jgi:nitroimidazol reductase NimA-like FMN-containing flavoprotein (pyridoxamine 5'-phosphate oxidase superfamily)
MSVNTSNTHMTMNPNIITQASAWNAATIKTYLSEGVLPCRMSCITSDGFPHVISLWYAYADEEFLFSVQKNMLAVRWLQAEPRCGFEIAADTQPYRGVRGRGTASVVPARERPVLDDLIERYLDNEDSSLARWLRSRPDSEMTIRVKPCWITSWDFGARMGDSEKP